MLNDILCSIRKRLYEIIPYSLVDWCQTNYLPWFIIRTVSILFLICPFEKKLSLGELTPNQINYIIGRQSWAGNGLFSCALGVVSAVEYAIERGYVPVVDMKNSDSMYLYPHEVGVVNAWELYFEQPMENSFGFCSLDDAYHSKHTILNNHDNGGPVQAFYPATTPSLLLKDTKIIRRWSTQFKKYIRLNHNTKIYVDNQYDQIIHSQDRVLGLCVRGGEYRYSNPFGHPVQPPLPELISQIRTFLEDWHCNKLFLTTDDEDILMMFIHEFGDIVISTNRRYTKYVMCNGDNGEYLRYIRKPDRENERYLSGLEYLTDIVILSRCNCIVGGTTCGMIAAVLMSDGFEHSYFFDCGVFGVTNKCDCGTFIPDYGKWILKTKK